MPKGDAEREPPFDSAIQLVRNHYINANYVRGYDNARYMAKVDDYGSVREYCFSNQFACHSIFVVVFLQCSIANVIANQKYVS